MKKSIYTMEQQPITTIGLARLREEFAKKQQERVYWVSEKEKAAALGDRSENAEYIAAKEMIRNLDKRLRFLQNLIRMARAINPIDIADGDVRFGKKVFFTNNTNLLLVGSPELSLFACSVSCYSPIGKRLLGKKVGEKITVRGEALVIARIESITDNDVNT